MDDQDEACEDGLHIVIGHLDRQQPDMSVSFVASGTRFILRPEDAVEGFTTPRPRRPSGFNRYSVTRRTTRLPYGPTTHRTNPSDSYNQRGQGDWPGRYRRGRKPGTGAVSRFAKGVLSVVLHRRRPL
jgi:hypothetical protein